MKNKSLKKQVILEENMPTITLNGQEFEIDFEKFSVPIGEGSPDIRQADISFYTQMDDKEKFKNWTNLILYSNAIEHILDPADLNRVLSKCKLNKLLLDCIVFDLHIEYEDDEGREASIQTWHGVGLTVKGRKHIEAD